MLDTFSGNVQPHSIEDELRDSFLSYAMSVIVSRALPDARDGLKPVHRRVLYAMQDLGLQPNRPYRKSATVVGDVMGKYHPHGDQAIYDALARMAQDFALRYPVVDGTIALIDDPELDDDEVAKHIKGPDFPTGGVIVGLRGIRDAIQTGRGSVRVQAKAHTEQIKGNRTQIVVTEIPYQVNKSYLLQKIAELVKDRKLQDISDLRDESDRNGMRIVIELKREAVPKVVLNNLYKHTQMQQSFGVNLVALVDGVPRTLSYRQALGHYIAHQFEVVTRRTRYELGRARARAHILEGLLIALGDLDEVVATIRRSRSVETARKNLMKGFGF